MSSLSRDECLNPPDPKPVNDGLSGPGNHAYAESQKKTENLPAPKGKFALTILRLNQASSAGSHLPLHRRQEQERRTDRGRLRFPAGSAFRSMMEARSSTRGVLLPLVVVSVQGREDA